MFNQEQVYFCTIHYFRNSAELSIYMVQCTANAITYFFPKLDRLLLRNKKKKKKNTSTTFNLHYTGTQSYAHNFAPLLGLFFFLRRVIILDFRTRYYFRFTSL